MSWGINPNATEKEKIFAEFNDSINGLNCADGLSYRHYSTIYDLGRKLADDEYNQGRTDERAKVLDEFANWCRENDIQCRKKIDGLFIEFSVSEIVNDFKTF